MTTEYNTPPQSAHPVRSDGGAIGSLVCGILGITICPVILSIVAIILGHMSRGRIARSGGTLLGSGKALAGLILGYLGILFSVLYVAVMIPVATAVIGDAKLTKMKSIGKNTYVSAYADAIDQDVVGFPDEGEFPTSTAYFKALAGENPAKMKILAATPDFLGGPHVTPATSWSSFSAENNGWLVVEGLSETSDAGIPFLISSNVKASRLSDLTGRVGDSIDPAAKGAMKKKVVIAETGGGTRILEANEEWPTAAWPDLTLKILPR